MGANVARGRSPSAWSARLPAAALAICGAAIAGYLALYQTGTISTVWEPLFGDGSRRVLESSLAAALPLPDAALGAAAYVLEAALLLAGGTDRWSRRPWIVLLGGLVVASMVAAAVVLVLAQVFVLHALCTLCLASASISLLIGALSIPEAAAAVGRVESERQRGLLQALAGVPAVAHARSAAARPHDR